METYIAINGRCVVFQYFARNLVIIGRLNVFEWGSLVYIF